MRALTPQELDEKEEGVSSGPIERWWTFEASPRYKGATYEYLQCVMGGGEPDDTFLSDDSDSLRIKILKCFTISCMRCRGMQTLFFRWQKCSAIARVGFLLF